jgi:hypothetical protein
LLASWRGYTNVEHIEPTVVRLHLSTTSLQPSLRDCFSNAGNFLNFSSEQGAYDSRSKTPSIPVEMVRKVTHSRKTVLESHEN